MRKNIGTWDKGIRLLLAAGLAHFIYHEMITGPLAIVLGVVAVIMLVTSLINFCPLYTPCGCSSSKK